MQLHFYHSQVSILANLLVTLCAVTQCFAQTVELNQLSLPELITRAEAGDPPAQVQMGLRFMSGRGVIHNLDKVREWMEKAAQAGNRTAIGVCAKNGWGRPRDLKLAFECFQEQTLKGDITAERNLGHLYAEGLGVEKDHVKALSLYKKTAETKDPLAYLFLGIAYVNGVGTEVDLEKGRFYLSEADKIGDCQAAYILAQLTLREGSKSQDSRPFVRLAWEQFSRSADAGYLPALDHLCLEHKDSAPDKAFEYWQKAAALGSPTGIHLVGTCYEKGIHVKADKVTPLFLYRRAAELGYADSHLRLAELLAAQPKKAREHWLKAGELGSGAGYHHAGLSYQTEKDYKMANQHYEKAIKLGYLGSEYQLGFNQLNGRGIEKSLEKGAPSILRSYKNGFIQGSPKKEYLARVDADIEFFKFVHSVRGLTDTIKVGPGNKEPKEASAEELMSEAWKLRLSGRWLEAIHLYLIAGGKGEGEAWHRLGSMCHDGKELPKNDELAISFLHKGVVLNSGPAHNRLGYHYTNGFGCEKDDVSARHYFELAANLKDGHGASNSGMMWSQGLGGPKDEAKAFFYYQKAAELADAGGMNQLGHCYSLGTGVPKNIGKAFECYLKAAKMGHRDGAFNAAYAYHFGKGVSQDISKAVPLYKLAVAQDSAPACNNLAGILNRGGKGVQKDARLARALFEKAARLGNKESQDYLRRAGLPKASTKPPPPPYKDKHVTELLGAAREDLDKEKLLECIQKCQEAISRLNPEDPDDWLAWTLAHSILAGAYNAVSLSEVRIELLDREDSVSLALDATRKGLMLGKSVEKKLAMQFPARCGRLYEEQIVVFAIIVSRSQDKELATSAEAGLAFALMELGSVINAPYSFVASSNRTCAWLY